jgi:alkanesulfonate monooxygenase SsuD/methylene tetrahydromethanopterin reductase-like flavin-dependent oxidoreductase (luciferase family)
MESTKERFWECLEIIRRAWTQESFSYEGKFYHYRDIALLPRPVQKPHPPIWVAAASPGSAEGVAQRGYAFCAAPFASSPSPEKITEQLVNYRQSFTQAGYGQPTDDLPHVFWTHLADSTAEALKEAEAGMKRKLGSVTKVWAKPSAGGEYDAFVKVGQFLATATIDQLDALSIFGDPERCLQKVKRYHAAGITHLMVMFDWGGMPQQTVFRSMELFARHVMPHFRELGNRESPALQAQSAV